MAFKKIKQQLRQRRLAKAGIKIDLDISSVAYGARSGIWTIAPHLLPEDCIVYSAGVGNNIRWDLEIIAHHRALVYAFDPTPRTVEWISEQDLSIRLTAAAIVSGTFFVMASSACGSSVHLVPRNRCACATCTVEAR